MGRNDWAWQNREENKKKARTHTERMTQKYSTQIEESAKKTKIYTNSNVDDSINSEENPNVKFTLACMDSTTAICKYHYGKTAVLNFASFSHPGGMFYSGSMAQEEALCHDSFLYNILIRHKTFYENNKKYINNGLYDNRALYSPDIIFKDMIKCDVITCASPNINAQHNISAIENSIAVSNRIRFIFNIAENEKVDTLILGAFGCGVFAQDANEVAKEMINYGSKLKNIKHIVFAVPKGENYDKFLRVYKTYSGSHKQ